MLFIDSLKTYAYSLWDASIVFPDQLRKTIRTPFKQQVGLNSIIKGMSAAAHSGLAITTTPEDHYWSYNVTTGVDEGGNLVQSILTTVNLLREATVQNDHGRMAAVCGRLSHLIIDGFVLLHTINFEPDGVTVRGRLVSDIETHSDTLPFLWEAIEHGDNFTLSSPLLDDAAIRISLNEGRQSMLQVANCYLYGNGWPAARGTVQKNYNFATNLLAKTVLTVVNGA